jgi:hypothetical protein
MVEREGPVADRGVEEFAEELARLLEVAQARAKDWLGQRQQIVKSLEGIRDATARLLQQLEHDAQGSTRRGGRPAGSRRLSVEARERISQAQLKRWAKQRAAKRRHAGKK